MGRANPSPRRGGQQHTFSGSVGTGPWAAFWLGLIGCPAAFYPFFVPLFFYLISKSFVYFAKELQFKSNKVLKFYKIQSNLLK
jgi:hypothetical protein